MNRTESPVLYLEEPGTGRRLSRPLATAEPSVVGAILHGVVEALIGGGTIGGPDPVLLEPAPTPVDTTTAPPEEPEVPWVWTVTAGGYGTNMVAERTQLGAAAGVAAEREWYRLGLEYAFVAPITIGAGDIRLRSSGHRVVLAPGISLGSLLGSEQWSVLLPVGVHIVRAQGVVSSGVEDAEGESKTHVSPVLGIQLDASVPIVSGFGVVASMGADMLLNTHTFRVLEAETTARSWELSRIAPRGVLAFQYRW